MSKIDLIDSIIQKYSMMTPETRKMFHSIVDEKEAVLGVTTSKDGKGGRETDQRTT